MQDFVGWHQIQAARQVLFGDHTKIAMPGQTGLLPVDLSIRERANFHFTTGYRWHAMSATQGK
jgi:hypothetical protein